MDFPQQRIVSPHVGANIKRHRQKAGITQVELAKRAGIDSSYTSQIEAGNSLPSLTVLIRISKELGVPLAEMLREEDLGKQTDTAESKAVPYFGKIPAGPPSECVADMGTVPVLHHLWAEDRYALQIDSDSMLPTLKPNDLVLVQWCESYDLDHIANKICICWFDGMNAVKRLKKEVTKQGTSWLLISDNKKYKPIRLGEYANTKIQGVVLGIMWRVP